MPKKMKLRGVRRRLVKKISNKKPKKTNNYRVVKHPRPQVRPKVRSRVRPKTKRTA